MIGVMLPSRETVQVVVAHLRRRRWQQICALEAAYTVEEATLKLGRDIADDPDTLQEISRAASAALEESRQLNWLIDRLRDRGDAESQMAADELWRPASRAKRLHDVLVGVEMVLRGQDLEEDL